MSRSKLSLKDCTILYINLDSRKDRKDNLELQLAERGLTAHRISGVNGQDIDKNKEKLSKEFGISVDKMNSDYWLSRRNFKTMCGKRERVLGRVGAYLGHLRAV